ncbi:hypothetical protein BKA81DRAFT_188765 [Phyllosticta paracitricarpa]
MMNPYQAAGFQPLKRRRRRPKTIAPLQEISVADLAGLDTRGDVEVFGSHDSLGRLAREYHSAWKKDRRYSEDLDPLFRRFQRSLIVVRPDFGLDKFGAASSCDDPELPTVDEDILVHLRRAVSLEPLVFDAYGNANHWQSDDFLFHVPFYTAKSRHEVQQDDLRRGIKTRGTCGDKRLTMESKKHEVYFIRQAISIAVFLESDKRYYSVAKRPIERYKWDKWVALAVAPDFVLTEQKIEELLEGRFDALPQFVVWKRTDWENDDKPWRKFKNAYFFQMHLVVVLFAILVEQWKKNMEHVDRICEDIENELNGNLPNFAYFQKESLDTLDRIYRASKNIETLEKCLHYVLDESNGIWLNFRNGKARAIMGDWEKRLKDLIRENESEMLNRRPPPHDTDRERYQVGLWKDILWSFADKQINSFKRISVRLAERREKLESMRQLVSSRNFSSIYC